MINVLIVGVSIGSVFAQESPETPVDDGQKIPTVEESVETNDASETIEVPEVCSQHPIRLGIAPTYVPTNQCPQKDFICPSPTFNATQDSFAYSQTCKMADISEYTARLAHYRLIEHNGAVIVGDNLDACVKGGLSAVEKAYRANRKYSSLFKTRKNVGETAPRVQFVSYEDGTFYGDGIDISSKRLPICTPMVWESKTSGKRADTRMIHLHCGTPSEIKNKCYVLPGSKTPRHTKIKMSSKRSSKIDQAFLELMNPTYAIADMQYKIDHGCDNKGTVPTSQLMFTWDMSVEETHSMLEQCVGSDGFNVAVSDKPHSIQLPALDYTAFNFEDVDALKTKMIEHDDRLYFTETILTEQVAVSKIRKAEYDSCIQELTTTMESLQDRGEMVQLEVAMTTLNHQQETWNSNHESVEVEIERYRKQIRDKTSQLQEFQRQLSYDFELMDWYVTALKKRHPKYVPNGVNVRTVADQYKRLWQDLEKQQAIVEQAAHDVAQGYREFNQLSVQMNASMQSVQPKKEVLKNVDIQFPSLSLTDIPYSTEGIQTCRQSVVQVQSLVNNLDEFGEQIDDFLQEIREQSKVVEESTQKMGQFRKVLPPHVVSLAPTRPVFDIRAFISTENGKLTPYQKRILRTYKRSYYVLWWYHEVSHPIFTRRLNRLINRHHRKERRQAILNVWRTDIQSLLGRQEVEHNQSEPKETDASGKTP